MSLRAQAVGGARWTTGATLAATIAQLLQYLILARILGPEQFGLMAMLTLVMGFSQIYSDVGINDAIIHRQDSDARTLSTLYWINLGVATMVTVIVVWLTPVIVWFFDELRLGELVWMIAPGIVLGALGRQFGVMARRELQFRSVAIAEIVAALAGLIAAISLGVLTRDVTALIYAFLLSTLVRSFGLALAGWRTWHPVPVFDARGIGPYLDFGFWNLSERSVNFVSGRLDQFIIGSVLGAQALGYYNLAWYLVVLPVSRINPVVTQVAFPVFARVQDDTARLRSGYLQVLRALGFVNFPILAGVAAVAGILMPLAFGNEWLPTIPVVQVLALVMLFRVVGNPSGSLLLATGNVRLSFKWNLFVALCQLPAILIAASYGGITGVALSLLLLQLLFLAPFYRIVVTRLIQPRLREYVGAIVPALAVSLAMGLLVYAASLAVQPTLPSLVVLIAAGAGMHVILCWCFLRSVSREMLSLVFSRQ